MGMASHLGPWLLGTVKNTTGTSAGQVRNMGATLVSQQATISYNDAANSNAFVIPAGSLVSHFFIYTTGITGTSPTLTVKLGAVGAVGTTVVNAYSLTTATAYANAMTLVASSTTLPLLNNTGSADQQVSYSFGGTLSAGTATLVCIYTVRNSDGSIAPTSAQS